MFCVIVGDIIQSKEMEPEAREAVNREIKGILNAINTEYMDYILAGFGLVRGDAFEGVLFTQQYAPRIIQKLIKAFYRAGQTRVRVSAVMDELTIISGDRNEADGPAFHIASHKIEQFKERGGGHWLQIAFTTNTPAQPVVDSLIELLSSLSEGWTDRQREIVWAMDDCAGQQKRVAEMLEVSASVVSKQLKAAYYQAYHRAWLNLEKYLTDIEEDSVSENGGGAFGYTAYYSAAKRKMAARRYDEAMLFFYKAIDIAKKELGEENPQLSALYNGLAEACLAKGFLGEAENAVGLSLTLQEKLPKARLEYAQTLNIMGDIMLAADRYNDAAGYYDDARETAVNAVGQDHPFIALCDGKRKRGGVSVEA